MTPNNATLLRHFDMLTRVQERGSARVAQRSARARKRGVQARVVAV